MAPASPVDLLMALGYLSALNLKRYLVAVGLAFAAIWCLRRLRDARRAPLQPGRTGWPQRRRELLLSLSTLVIGAAVVPVMMVFGWSPQRAFYADIDTHGWVYFGLSVLLMMAVRDTLFYFSHRAMHHRAVFRFFHRSHHRSVKPNPWTGYAVHPLESLFDAVLPTLVILFLVPKHPVAYLIFLWIDVVYAVYGHMGIELYPRGFSRHWLGRWINTATAHDAHHATGKWNYSYYFLFWDRVLGTLDPAYDQRFDEATLPATARTQSATAKG